MAGHPQYEQLEYVQNYCIYNGPSDNGNLFQPDEYLTMEAMAKIYIRMLAQLAGRDVSNNSNTQLTKFAFELFLLDIIDSYQAYDIITHSQSDQDAHVEPSTKSLGLYVFDRTLEFGTIHRFNNSPDLADHLTTAEIDDMQYLIDQMIQ